jgi:hypothetical protein
MKGTGKIRSLHVFQTIEASALVADMSATRALGLSVALFDFDKVEACDKALG